VVTELHVPIGMELGGLYFPTPFYFLDKISFLCGYGLPECEYKFSAVIIMVK